MEKKIDFIQLVRGIGALLVCSFHMKTLLNTSGFAYGSFFFGSGAIGVPIFFILSGFIIVYTTQNSSSSLGSIRVFALKRVVRIVPLYYLVTFIWIVGLGQVGYYFLRHPDLLVRAATFVPSFSKDVGPSFGFPPVAVGWTLYYEMLFYLIFCVSLLFGRFRYAVLSSVIVALVVGLPLLTGSMATFDPSHCYGFSYSYFEVLASPVMLYFLLGIGLGWVYLSSFTLKHNVSRLLVCISLIYFWLAYFGIGRFSDSIFTNILTCGGLLFSLLMLHKNRRVMVYRPLVYLGDISYSLYLIHPLVIVFLPKILCSIGLSMLAKGPILFVIALLFIFTLSAISYEVIERRMLSRLSRAVK